ncbi:MAG: hypothetical protein LBR45_03795 [Bacteroidales bacterium]|nr:hypothetical protein [Bacteroidales bacterium]
MIIVLGLLETLAAQEIQLPDKISITDKFFSPWGTDLLYEYELKLNENDYSIQVTTIRENRENKNGDKELGIVDKKLIENILLTIKQQQTETIQISNFEDKFTDAIKNFLKQEADNYWIHNEYQKQFIIEELTNPDKLRKNIELYFKNYDHSGYMDGSSTEVKIIFHFADSVLSVSTKSILWVGLPLEINGEKNFSPKLASLIGELIPESKTERKKQFKGDKLFLQVIRETVRNHREQIGNLESKTYQVHIDSLMNRFFVSDTRIINGTFSVNWNGEKRFGCTLIDSSMVSNVSISYSTTIEDGKIKFPVSLIMANSKQLYSLVMSSTFFREYLAGNEKRHLSIIYDDNSSFTDKVEKSALEKCKSLKTSNLDNAVFISLENEFGRISRWGLFPNGQYFMWWNEGKPPTPANDKNYLKCE